jgi:hypothetical protein
VVAENPVDEILVVNESAQAMKIEFDSSSRMTRQKARRSRASPVRASSFISFSRCARRENISTANKKTLTVFLFPLILMDEKGGDSAYGKESR